MNLINKAHNISHLAVLGLGLVLMVMTLFAIWAAQTTQAFARDAHLTSRKSDQYQSARYVVGAEESLERKYRLEPGREVFQRHHEAATTLIAALQNVQKMGDAHDRTVIPTILEAHRKYLVAVSQMFAAVDAGDTRRVLAIDSGEVDPIFGSIEKTVNEEADKNHLRAIQSLATLNQVQQTVKKTTPLVFIVGLGLLFFFWRIHNTRLQSNEAHYRSLVRNTSDVIAILTLDSVLRYVSPAAERIWHYPVTKLQGKNLTAYIHPEDRGRSQELLDNAAAHAGANVNAEWRLRHADGSWHYVDVVANYLPDEPHIQGLLVTFRDITDRKAAEDALTHQAFHDALSGLPNRPFFLDRLTWAFSRARRHKEALAVMFLDLDNFKVINDSLGHEAGDHLLIAVAERFKSCIRPGDIVARLGGDEFTILLENIADVNDVLVVVARISEQLQKPISLLGRDVFVSASIGIVQLHNNHIQAERNVSIVLRQKV